MKYVQRRANRYEFRFPLPDDLAGKPAPSRPPASLAPLLNERTGRFKTEVIRSLKTNDGRAADRSALRHIAEAHALVDAARRYLADGPSASLSTEQLASLVHNHEVALLTADEKVRREGLGLDLGAEVLQPDGRGLTRDDADLYAFSLNYLNDELRDQAARMRPGDEIARFVEDRLKARGIELAPDDPARRDLELGIVAARRRAFDVIQARLQGETVPTPALACEQTGLTLRGALQRWAEGGGRGARKPRTGSVAEAERAVNRFIELHGDLPLTSITKGHGRAFRDALAKLPKDLPRRLQRTTLPELLATELNGHASRSAQTVNKVLALLGGIVTRAEKDGFFDDVSGWSNPFHVRFEIVQTDRQPYEPFSSDELKALFASPVFAAVARPTGGAGEAAYWLPLVALYSGARRTEIAQLSVADVRTSPDGVPFLDFNDDGQDQSLKNASSARSVPIHPELVRLGLLDHAHERRQSVGATGALWTGFEPPIAGKAKAWSKWFGRYLGEHVTSARAKTFHSFRHTFKRACREAGITEEVHHAFTGHAGGGVGRRYGRERREDGSLDRGVSISRLAAEIARVGYPCSLRQRDPRSEDF